MGKKITNWILIVVMGSSFFSLIVYAQTFQQELTLLRQQLQLPNEIQILTSSASLPKKKQLSLFLALGLATKTQENFMKWVKQWNQMERNIELKVVDELPSADIALVRMLVPPQVFNPSERNVGEAHVLSTEYEAIATVPIQTGQNLSEYNYILIKNTNRWEVIEREISTSSKQESKQSGKTLWKLFRKKLLIP